MMSLAIFLDARILFELENEEYVPCSRAISLFETMLDVLEAKYQVLHIIFINIVDDVPYSDLGAKIWKHKINVLLPEEKDQMEAVIQKLKYSSSVVLGPVWTEFPSFLIFCHSFHSVHKEAIIRHLCFAFPKPFDKEPLIISHRGNTFGPHSSKENSIDAMQHCFELNFGIELDLHSNKLFGHDQGENKISFSYIHQNQARTFIHAKSGDALQFALDQGFHCFSHDQDDYVLTSQNYIWRYPRSGLKVTNRTIIVLPENDPTLTDADFRKCAGVCTDFPILFRFYLSYPSCDYIWYQGLVLERRYNRLPFSPCSARIQNDPSFVLYSFARASQKLRDLYETIRFHFPEAFPRIFTDKTQKGMYVEFFTLKNTACYTEEDMRKHLSLEKFIDCDNSIIFHRVIAIENDLVLVGYPSMAVLALEARCAEIFNQNKNDQTTFHMILVKFREKKPTDEAIERITEHLPIVVSFPFLCVRS